jgi:hypothetical protein
MRELPRGISSLARFFSRASTSRDERELSARADRCDSGRTDTSRAASPELCVQFTFGRLGRKRGCRCGRMPAGQGARQARSFAPSPTSHGLAAKPSERASRSERTAGTIPRLDGNTACTTPDRELNDGSSRTNALFFTKGRPIQGLRGGLVGCDVGLLHPAGRPEPKALSTSRRVLVFTPGAPAVQILVSAMRALDRSQLVVEFSRGRLASCLCERNGNDKPARLVLTHPADVGIAWDHLMRHPDVDVAQAR